MASLFLAIPLILQTFSAGLKGGDSVKIGQHLESISEFVDLKSSGRSIIHSTAYLQYQITYDGIKYLMFFDDNEALVAILTNDSKFSIVGLGVDTQFSKIKDMFNEYSVEVDPNFSRVVHTEALDFYFCAPFSSTNPSQIKDTERVNYIGLLELKL